MHVYTQNVKCVLFWVRLDDSSEAKYEKGVWLHVLYQ